MHGHKKSSKLNRTPNPIDNRFLNFFCCRILENLQRSHHTQCVAALPCKYKFSKNAPT